MQEEHYTLNLPDLDVNIDLVPDFFDYSFSHEINSGLTKRFQLIGFSNNYKSKQITVIWSEEHIIAGNGAIKSEQVNYIEADPNTYKVYHDAEINGVASGLAYAKQCIQGIMFRIWGHRPFDLDGNFVQYTP